MLLDKPYDDDDLWDAIREALQKDESQRGRQQHRQEMQQRIDSLTDKELEVMKMMVDGKANKVIARQLDVSIRTVESRRHEVFNKMRADSLAELVRMLVDWQPSQKDAAI